MGRMNNETTVARLILGTMSYGTTIDQDRAFALMDRFVAAGGVWLDTADCYAFWDDPSGVGGASERVIGRWLRANDGIRERVSIATKVRQNPLVPHRWPESAEGLSAHAIVTAMAGSLDRLGVESVDLLWAHAEDRSVPLAETVAAFGDLVSSGTVGRVGAANHASWRVEKARAAAHGLRVEPWSAVQLRHSLIQPRPDASLPNAGDAANARLIREADERCHGGAVARGIPVLLHPRGVGVVAGAGTDFADVVKRVDATFVAARRLAEQRLMGKVPRCILEPPPAEPGILAPVPRPGAGCRNVHARAGTRNELLDGALG